MKQALEQLSPFSDTEVELCCPAAEGETSETESPLRPGEIAQLRLEKLEAVRVAIANGSYDSDVLLEKAMNLMLQRLVQLDRSTGW